MKSLIRNYEGGVLTLEAVAALSIRSYFEEAINCLLNDDNNVKKEVSIFLASETEEWLRNRRFPIPRLDFAEVIEIFSVVLLISGRELWITPEDTLESLFKKFEEA